MFKKLILLITLSVSSAAFGMQFTSDQQNAIAVYEFALRDVIENTFNQVKKEQSAPPALNVPLVVKDTIAQVTEAVFPVDEKKVIDKLVIHLTLAPLGIYSNDIKPEELEAQKVRIVQFQQAQKNMLSTFGVITHISSLSLLLEMAILALLILTVILLIVILRRINRPLQ